MDESDEQKPTKKGISWGRIAFALLVIAYIIGRYVSAGQLVTLTPMTCGEFNSLGRGVNNIDKILDTPANDVQRHKYKEVIAQHAVDLSYGSTPTGKALQLAMKNEQFFIKLIDETLAMTRVSCIERKNDPMRDVAVYKFDYVLKAIAKKNNF